MHLAYSYSRLNIDLKKTASMRTLTHKKGEIAVVWFASLEFLSADALFFSKFFLRDKHVH
jgi:hypothetical protein